MVIPLEAAALGLAGTIGMGLWAFFLQNRNYDMKDTLLQQRRYLSDNELKFQGTVAELKIAHSQALKALQTELDNLRKAMPERKNSIELTEFLNDFKTNGFSLVRVNPDNVFLRSPKG